MSSSKVSLDLLRDSTVEPDWAGMETMIMRRVAGLPPASRPTARGRRFPHPVLLAAVWLAFVLLQSGNGPQPMQETRAMSRTDRKIAREFPELVSGEAGGGHVNPRFERQLAEFDLK